MSYNQKDSPNFSTKLIRGECEFLVSVLHKTHPSNEEERSSLTLLTNTHSFGGLNLLVSNQIKLRKKRVVGETA